MEYKYKYKFVKELAHWHEVSEKHKEAGISVAIEFHTGFVQSQIIPEGRQSLKLPRLWEKQVETKIQMILNHQSLQPNSTLLYSSLCWNELRDDQDKEPMINIKII